MTITDLQDWLERLGLGGYSSVFAENDVDLDVLPHLSDEDLKGLGLSLGHRRKLLAAIPKLTQEPDSAASTLRTGTPDQPRIAEAERRQLSVLFCDLVGSTELSQRLDPEHLRELMRRYQDAVAGAVTRYEGFVAKFLGDGVLAYFGWPQAHEDQAERAVHAALDAVAAVAGLRADGQQELQARVGIATGQVVIGEIVNETAGEAGAVVGETPNLAARLQSLAEPGSVIIDSTTRRLAGPAFELEDRGAHPLKGFREAVPVWRVAGEALVESRFEAAHGAALTEFVGRTQELSLLLDRWTRARDGEGQVVLLSGEAGIGKSRILRELQEELRADPHAVLHYQCSPYYVNAAFHPVVEQLRHGADFHHDDTPEIRLDKLERLLRTTVGDDPEIAALMAALLSLPADRYPSLGITPQKQKLRTIEALGDRVQALSRQRSVLMLVEDVHWVDPSTLEWMDAVIERVQSLPVLVVVTHRPEFQARWTGYGHLTVHSLNRLSHSDGKAMAERITGGKTLPEQVLTQILKQTDGVPLFVEELTKTVLEAGFLEERDGRYELEGPLPPLAIPTTLHDSLMARLDRLAPVKEVVQAAACIGREFEPDLLTEVVSLDSEDLEDALDQLVQSGLIFRRRTAEGPSYLFKHALVQDTAYESLLMRKRRQIHADLARTLEGRADTDPLALARHCAAAGLAEKAVGHYLAAGQHLLATSALPEAVNALELGQRELVTLEPSDRRDRLELDLRVALGTARMANFGWPHGSVAEALEPAFGLATQIDDRGAMGPLLWGLWVHYQTRTEFPQAHEWLAKLDEVAEESGDPELLAVRDMSSGCQYFWEAEYDRAASYTEHIRATYDEARHARIVRYANHDPLCFSLHWAGSLLDWIVGYPDRALDRLEEALDIARRLGHPFNAAFALTGGSQSLIMRGEAERMLAQCDEAERIVADQGLGKFAEHSMLNHWRGQAYILRGELARGFELTKRGNDYFNASGGRICNAMWWCLMTQALAGMDRPREALALIERALAHCRDTGDRYMEPEVLRLKGELLLQGSTCEHDDAEAVLAAAQRVARAHQAKSWELRAATSLARLNLSRDRRREALDLLEPVYDWFEEGFDTADLKAAHALLNELS